MDKKGIDTMFDSVPMSNETMVGYYEVKHRAYKLASAIYNYIPESRERSLAFTKLEEAIMWANKGLSRHG